LTVLSIPSPPIREWLLFGRVPIRFYALCIITGVIVGVVIATRRWMARGGSRDAVETVALVSVPFGIVGARLYHVITDHQLYFGPGKIWYHAFFIWDGGLGIWGGVALGAVGGYLVARRRKIRFWALADALAPGVAVAQAIGRLGNWFNQELFGKPSTLPWALQIAPEYRPDGYTQYATFHPTFLYELIWDLGVAVGIVLLDRKFKLGHGKVFVLYVMFYTIGRAWVEHLRIDPAHTIGGFRINDYVSVVVCLAALAVFIWLTRTKHGREPIVEGDFVYVNGQPPKDVADTPDSADAPDSAEKVGAGQKDAPHPDADVGATPVGGEESSEDRATDGTAGSGG
jgi:prolipoprotein diacylglyceryl transferase